MDEWSDAEDRVEKARQLFQQRKWTDALREIRLAISLNPHNAAWYFNTGLILDELERFDEAVEVYQRANQLDPDDLATLHRLGSDLGRVGQIREAIGIFQQIQKLDASFEPGYCGRILLHARAGEHDIAEEMFYTARLYREHCPDCYYNIACSLEERGLHDKAIYCWNRALDLQATQGDIHLRIARSARKKGDWELARRHFLTDLRLDPDRDSTLGELAVLLEQMGHLEEAVDIARRAVRRRAEDPENHCRAGRLLLKIGRDLEAEESFSAAIRLAPDHPGANLGLARVRLHQEDIPAARVLLGREMRLRHEEPATLLELSNRLLDVGEDRAALACLNRLVRLRPNFTAGWVNLAVVRFRRGDWLNGIASCRSALNCPADDPAHRDVALYNLAVAFERLGRFNTALRWVAKARAANPSDPSLSRLNRRLRLLRLRRQIARTAYRWLARVFGL